MTTKIVETGRPTTTRVHDRSTGHPIASDSSRSRPLRRNRPSQPAIAMQPAIGTGTHPWAGYVAKAVACAKIVRAAQLADNLEQTTEKKGKPQEPRQT